MFRSKAVLGKVRIDSLRLRKRIWYRNSFQTFLFAKMLPERKGTHISGDLGVHPVIQVFAFMMLGVVVFALLGRWSTQGGLTSAAETLVIVGFFAGVVGFSRFLARDEGRFLTYFLVETVKGQLQELDSATRIVQDR